MAYGRLECIGIAQVDSRNPSTVIQPQSYSEGYKYFRIVEEQRYTRLILKYQLADPASVRRRIISSVEFAFLFGMRVPSEYEGLVGQLDVNALDREIENIDHLTYNNFQSQGASSYNAGYARIKDTNAIGSWRYVPLTYSSSLKRLFNSFCVDVPNIVTTKEKIESSTTGRLFTEYSGSSDLPYISFSVSNSIVPYTVKRSDDTQTSINPDESNTFEWLFQPQNTNDLYIPAHQASAIFYWTSIADGSLHSIGITGDVGSVTIPENTFPTTGIQWWVSVTDEDGNVDTSVKYTVKTGDFAAEPLPSSPVQNAIRDSREQITFSWSYNDQATVHKKAEIRYSYDQQNWQALIDNLAAEQTQYIVPANTFDIAHYIYWQVRAYNADDVLGKWSSCAAFDTRGTLVTSTPKAPVNNAYRDRFSEIVFSWTNSASGVEGSELEYSLDGNSWVTLGSTAAGVTTFTVQANYFSLSGKIWWRVRSYNSYGAVGNWSTAYFNTAESIPTVTNLLPNGTYQNKAQAVTFSWHTNITNGAIAGSQIEYDLSDGQGWRMLGTVEGDGTNYTAPANKFPAIAYSDDREKTLGIRIRARSKNRDGQFSDWASASFATVDAQTAATPSSPVNGAARDETSKISFSWSTSNALGSQPTGADIQWRLDGGEWQDLGSVSGSDKSYSAEANTFPGNIIYWRVRAYNQDGVDGDWSSEARFTTVDAPSVSAPQFPIGTIEDTDSELTFTWTTSSTSGTAPTGADVQYSYDGSTWETLGHTDGTRSLTVQGGTIHAGTVQWRVRSYNRNGTAGAWSSPATFVAHAAPRVLEVLADGKPFTTITWQATDQQNYHIIIDDTITIGPVFSEDKSYQLSDYLEDGLHTVKLRVQNNMSIWSEWGEVTFNVVNVPGEGILLQGISNTDTHLSWDDVFSGPYMIYRDGKLIGKSGKKAFTDRVILGEHNYHVIRRLDDGYYSMSNIYTGVMSTKVTLMAPLTGGEWTPLQKSENAKRTERFTRKRAVAYYHFSGNKFPTPEVGEQEELIGEYDAAWMYTEEGARVLDSLIGQAIIIKSRGNEVMIGVFEGYTKVNRKHFHGYSFNLTHMDWEDYVCEE